MPAEGQHTSSRGSVKAPAVTTWYCALTNGWSLDIQRRVIHGEENTMSKDMEAWNFMSVFGEHQVAWLGEQPSENRCGSPGTPVRGPCSSTAGLAERYPCPLAMMEDKKSSVRKPGRQRHRSVRPWDSGRVKVFPEEVMNLACDARGRSGVALNRR